MKTKLVSFAFTLVAAGLLAGCGVDAAQSAATAAELKKQEIEQGKKTMAHAQEKINAAVDAMNQQAAHRGDDGE